MTKLHKQIAGQSAARISAARPLPLYFQLYETLRLQIQDGVWNNGDFFPPIPVLADQFNVATVTVRQAIGLLQKDELVQSRQGRGTVITSSALQLQPLQLESTVTEILDLYAEDSPDVESIDEGLAMPPLKAGDFHLLPSYFFIKRAHIRHGGRYCLITFFLAEPLFREHEDRFRNHLALPVLFSLDDLGIARAWQLLRLEKADHSTATILKVPASDPIARVKRYITNRQDELIYFADVRYRGDAIQYNMELKI
jgi:GntR family transcriptional regulator